MIVVVRRTPTPAPVVMGAARDCSVLAALAVVGDFWTLAILRCVFLGRTRFSQIHDELGVATNVLTDRLRRLTENDVLEKRAYQQRPVRHEYVLTDRGRELAPILLTLKEWGDGLSRESRRAESSGELD